MALVLAAAMLLAVAGQPQAPAQPAALRLTDVALTCPALSTTSASAAVVAANVVTELAAAPGGAAVQVLSQQEPVATIGSPDAPVTVEVTGAPPAPLLALGEQGWAAALMAGTAVRTLEGPGSGIASVQCPPPAAQWWFVGAGTSLGRASVLHVTNPADEPARFDISLIGRTGRVDPVAGRGLEVPGRTGLKLGLDALAPGQDLLAVHVSATAGRLAVAVSDRAAPVAERPRGVDFIPPAAPPDRRVVLAGIPAGSGRRTLVLVNPSDSFATASVTAITDSGRGTLTGLSTVVVPARGIVSVDLADSLSGRSASLVLDADQPISASLQATWGTARRESMWLAATPAVPPSTPLAGAGVVPAGQSLRTTVTVTASQDAVFGSLTVMGLGAERDSVFAADGGRLADDPDPQLLVLPPAGDGPGQAGAAQARRRVRINVPAGTQRQLTLTDVSDQGAVLLYWLAEPGSGAAHVSHTTANRSASAPLATGYQWWPTQSYVPAVPVTNDPSVLVGLP